MSKIDAVIVDDEAPAREIISEYLSDYKQITVKAVFGDSTEAIGYLQGNSVDLLFLDIQMPGLTGFELLAKLKTLPDIIFSTAYDKYALRAFEVNAVDYLLKPYTKERFDKALHRVLESREPDDQQKERLKQVIRQSQNPGHLPDRIFVRTRKSIIPISYREVIWIEADGDYSRIHTVDKTRLCSKRLGEMEELLDSDQFLRVHRSSIIAIKKLKRLEPDAYGGFIATLENEEQVKVSRSHAEKIKKIIW